MFVSLSIPWFEGHDVVLNPQNQRRKERNLALFVIDLRGKCEFFDVWKFTPKAKWFRKLR